MGLGAHFYGVGERRQIAGQPVPPLLNAPTIELVDATELKKPMSRYRRF